MRGVPGDGDCFDRALFGLIGELPPGVRPVQVGKPMNPTDDEIRALRQQLARRVATIFRDFNLTGRLPPWLTTSQFRGAFDGATEADRLRAQVRHVLRILKMGEWDSSTGDAVVAAAAWLFNLPLTLLHETYAVDLGPDDAERIGYLLYNGTHYDGVLGPHDHVFRQRDFVQRVPGTDQARRPRSRYRRCVPDGPG